MPILHQTNGGSLFQLNEEEPKVEIYNLKLSTMNNSRLLSQTVYQILYMTVSINKVQSTEKYRASQHQFACWRLGRCHKREKYWTGQHVRCLGLHPRRVMSYTVSYHPGSPFSPLVGQKSHNHLILLFSLFLISSEEPDSTELAVVAPSSSGGIA